MSIDDYAGGAGRGAASLLLRNRDHDFPAWQGRDLAARDLAARLHLLASDRATATTVAHQELPRLRRLGGAPSLATVTMGGNDLFEDRGYQVTAPECPRKHGDAHQQREGSAGLAELGVAEIVDTTRR
jgi:hypothetical protein